MPVKLSKSDVGKIKVQPSSSKELDKLITEAVKIIGKALPGTKLEIKFGLQCYWPFCYFTLKPNYFIIGLTYGVMLTDPLKKLEGNQKFVRHYKVATKEDLNPKYLKMLVEESLELYDQGVRPFRQN